MMKTRVFCTNVFCVNFRIARLALSAIKKTIQDYRKKKGVAYKRVFRTDDIRPILVEYVNKLCYLHTTFATDAERLEALSNTSIFSSKNKQAAVTNDAAMILFVKTKLAHIVFEECILMNTTCVFID